MGLGNLLVKGIKVVASAALNQVADTMELSKEMERYSDGQLRRILKDPDSSTKEKSAATMALKKRG